MVIDGIQLILYTPRMLTNLQANRLVKSKLKWKFVASKIQGLKHCEKTVLLYQNESKQA